MGWRKWDVPQAHKFIFRSTIVKIDKPTSSIHCLSCEIHLTHRIKIKQDLCSLLGEKH